MNQKQDNLITVLDAGSTKSCVLVAELLDGVLRYRGHGVEPSLGMRKGLIAELGPAAEAINRAALAEGLAFAEANGIGPAAALAVFRSGPAYSKIMDTKGGKMIDHDFKPEARLSQHLKDVRLILKQGEKCGARLPLSQVHRKLLEEVEAAATSETEDRLCD